MSKVLVTGGAGFIGSNFVDLLKTKNDVKWQVLDNFTYAAYHKKTDVLTGDSRWIDGDICDASIVRNCIQTFRPDCIVNFAAESHVDRSISTNHHSEFLRTNIMGTHTLLSLAMEYDVSRFVQISTDEVYGSLNNTLGNAFTEQSPMMPNNPYSASKANADNLCRAFYQTYGFPVIVTRCSNNYGPHQHSEKFIPNMIRHALAGKPLPVYGNGSNIRDWIHVHDHCNAIYNVMQNGAPGDIYNIGADQEFHNTEIATMIIDIVGQGGEIQYVEDRLGHDWRYAMNASKIKNELKWKPEIEFEQGLRTLIEGIKQNG